jgi:hypothetical protein
MTSEVDFFEMARHARHDVRIKVCEHHGTRMLPGRTATVSVRPHPWLVAGNLSPADFDLVSRWIIANETAIVDYWENRISTVDLVRRLQPLP